MVKAPEAYSTGGYNITGDQRWNRWGRGRTGVKALFTFLPFYLFTFLPLKAFYLFTQFPISMGKVMDELPSSLGPYEIGMGGGSAHLLLSAIALRVKEGAVAGAALG